MSRVIILTADQAAKVRGRTGPYTALDPIALDDGTFALSVEVLTDPAHAAALATLKRRAQGVDVAVLRTVDEAEMTAVLAQQED